MLHFVKMTSFSAYKKPFIAGSVDLKTQKFVFKERQFKVKLTQDYHRRLFEYKGSELTSRLLMLTKKVPCLFFGFRSFTHQEFLKTFFPPTTTKQFLKNSHVNITKRYNKAIQFLSLIVNLGYRLCCFYYHITS